MGLLSFVPVFTVLSGVSMVGVLGLCYSLSMTLGDHLPPWVQVPFPSYTSLHEPETLITSIGVPACSLLMTVCLAVFHVFLRANVEHEVSAHSRVNQMRWNLMAFCSLVVACTGAIGSALFHVQSDIFRAVHEDTADSRQLTTFINSTCNTMFVLGATAHTLIVWLLISSSSHLGHLRIHWSHRLRVILFCLALFSMTVYVLFQPFGGAVTKNQMIMILTIGAAAQWVALFSFIAIFITYSSDLVILLESLGEYVFVLGRSSQRRN